MARVLLLREAQEARRTAALLAGRGHEPLLLPLQELRILDPEPPAGPFAGLLATSGHAAAWLARHYRGAPVPVLAVGARTAACLSAAGFGDVRTGPGRAGDLAAMAAELAAAAGRPLLYAAGRVRLPDLEAALAARGVPVSMVEAYDMEDRPVTEEEAQAALGGRAPDAVLLLSRRQAELFLPLAEALPALKEPGLDHLCLSREIAERLPPGRRARVAPRPDLPHLLDLIG